MFFNEKKVDLDDPGLKPIGSHVSGISLALASLTRTRALQPGLAGCTNWADL